MEKNEASKNKTSDSAEVIFNYVSAMPFRQALIWVLTNEILLQSVYTEEIARGRNYIVYELAFIHHRHIIRSGYQLRLAAWAKGELTHLQLFRLATKSQAKTRLHNLRIIAQRLLLGFFLFGAIIFACSIQSPLLLIIFGILAAIYSTTLTKDFKLESFNHFQADDEALIMRLIKTDFSDTTIEDAELAESLSLLSLEDYLKQKRDSS